jgi:hypothetical protein
MAIEKMKILGAILELPAIQHCHFSPFGPFSLEKTLRSGRLHFSSIITEYDIIGSGSLCITTRPKSN